MRKEKLKELLNELAERTTERVDPGLSEDIKHQIPRRLLRHRGGWDTVNIIIDLRMSKSVAASVIIITMILLANFLGSRDSTGGGIFQDSMLLIKYVSGWAGADINDVSAGRSKYELLLSRGEEVAWYGDDIDPQDNNAVLMQWKLSEGKYGVMLVDGRERQVSSEELIKLLTRMLQKKSK
ncbi:MAG: hypothetical protein ACYS9C_03570 [Planctomycetota bacterium]|jgi:hypothetical protein